MTDLPIEIMKATGSNLNGNAVLLTAVVKISTDAQMSEALQLLRSKTTKELVFDKRHEFGLTNYGIAVSGGPRPIREGDKVVSYEQDYKLTKSI